MSQPPVCYICGRAENDALGSDGMVTCELRPYGVDGQPICYDCMMATPETQAEASAQFNRIVDGIEATGKTPCITDYGVVPLEGDES